MKIVQMTPINDRVLVEPIDLGEQKKGNILIPDLGEEKVRVGKVVAVGPGRQTEFGSFISVNVKVGDVVVLPKLGAQRVEVDGKEYWVIADKEIIAVAELN